MLHLPRRVIVQLAVFTVIAVGVLAITFLHFVRLPAMLFGVGRYTVTMELVEAGGLYRTGNVTYRGFEVGRVAAVRLTDTGVQAVLALKSGIDIPSDLKAEVHSHTAIGETYVELLPRNAASPPLKNGDVIALADTSVPPDINDLLSAANTALEAIPHENLQTVIDESYTAVAGLGLELSRLIKGSAELAIDARANLDPLVALIDRAGPVLDSQTHTSDAIAAWAAQLAAVTGQLQTHDSAVGDLIDRGGPALGETRQLLERLQPTVPILLANLVSVGQVALTYHNDIEQLLVVFPMAIAAEQAGILASRTISSSAELAAALGACATSTTDDGMAVDGGRSNTTVTSSPRALVMAHPSSLSTSITIARWRSRHQPSGRLPITFIPSTIHRTPHGTTAPPHRVCRRRLCVCRTTTICAFGASSALAGTSGNAPARIALPKPQGR